MPGNTTLPRAGGRVRARRRDGGRWHKAHVVAVRDDACDLDFANYGVVEGVPAERIQGTEAPTRRRPPPASLLPKPRIRVRKAGHKPAEPYRGDRKVDKRLKDSIGWCATRGDVDTLEEVLRRRGLGARDAHGWSWLHHAAAGGATAVGGDACGAMGTGVLGKLGPTPPLWLAAANEAAAARCACRPCSLSTRHTRRLASSETDARVVKSVGHHVTAVTSVGCPHSTTGGALGRAASQI